ncbi:MAG: TIGR02281 family clan AA aspartic protease [Rhodocyclaceae bacterium]|nr:TIGR02281 family clan AA aspartic protease [Rhodocyclaceae bacterium]MCL4757274.1 TIGR02281 family clan AA aspartic protease [Rhodocyclaceae bacterium]
MRAVLVFAACALIGSTPFPAQATEVELAGVFGGKAVLIVDGGAPRTLSVGQRTREGVRLLEVGEKDAVVEVGGKRQRVALGQAAIRSGAPSDAAEAHLVADGRGHFYASGSVNGAAVRFLVDTGATMVSLGASDARRAGLNPGSGTAVNVQTANGLTRAWHMKIDTLVLEGIRLHGVDALVHEGDLPIVLLGMSFLNRMDMRREGGRLLLRKRF